MREEEMRKPENIEHEVIDRLKNLDVEDFDYNSVDANYADAVLKARNIILDLYNKEKEKNKELEVKFLVEHTDNLYNKEEASEEMILRYKIKAKIEELNKEMLNEENSLELFYRKKYCKEVLQSLLEKE